jgi:hypothetical protein
VNTSRHQILEAAGLRVRFVWRLDRYAHEIWIAEGGVWLRALVSVEGSPQEAWPASPPFQSLHVEQRQGQEVALLVGMAGTSHWSASAQLDPRGPAVTFDVAARVRSPDRGPLGSAYRTAPEWSASRGDHCPLEIELLSELHPTQLERGAGLVNLSVARASDSHPRTVRWAYRLRPLGVPA